METTALKTQILSNISDSSKVIGKINRGAVAGPGGDPVGGRPAQ